MSQARRKPSKKELDAAYQYVIEKVKTWPAEIIECLLEQMENPKMFRGMVEAHRRQRANQ